MTQHSRRGHIARLTGLLALTAAAGVVLAGCSGTGGGSSSDGGNVEITLGIQTQTNQEKPYTTMVAKFEEENPNIKVNIVETPSADYGNVIRTQFQAGNAPDVLYGSPGSGNANSLIPYAEAGYLLPLTEYDWATAAVPESADALYYADDELWALPTDVAPITWNLNQTVFDELGLEYATTVDEVYEQCADARTQGKNLIQLAGSIFQNTGIASLEIAASRVYSQDPDWNDKRANGEVTFADTEGWVETLEVFKKLQEEGCYQDGAEAGTFDDLFPAVAGGQAASLFAPAGVMADLNALNADNEFTVIPFPGDTEEDTFLFASPSNALGVNAATKQKDASIKLLEFFAEPANQDAMVELTGNVSLQTVLTGATPPEQFANIEPWLADPEKNAPLANLFWPNGAVYDALGTGAQGILTGQATPEQVLQAMDDAWDNG
jgi:raffinose/stachyose/melibiose transport system substrate-binding protein